MEPRLIWFLLGPLHFGASPFLVCQHAGVLRAKHAVAIYSVFRLPRYPHSTSCCCCHQFPFSCFSHLRKKIVRIRASTFYSQKTNKKPQLLWQTNSRNCEPFVVGLNKRERERRIKSSCLLIRISQKKIQQKRLRVLKRAVLLKW